MQPPKENQTRPPLEEDDLDMPDDEVADDSLQDLEDWSTDFSFNSSGSLQASRPLVVLKIARTGSSWLGHALQETGAWCRIVDEVTNHVVSDEIAADGNPNKTTCDALTKIILNATRCPMDDPRFGGFTLNPLKFMMHRSSNPTSCWPEIRQALSSLNPYVVVLSRRNTVQQAASKLKSKAIIEQRSCNTPWHLENCTEDLQAMRIRIEPSLLAETAAEYILERDEVSEAAVGMTPEGSPPLNLTYEEMLNEEHLLYIPDRLRIFLGLPLGQHAGNVSLVASKLDIGSSPRLAGTLDNFEEVYEYFRENHSSLVPLLTEAS